MTTKKANSSSPHGSSEFTASTLNTMASIETFATLTICACANCTSSPLVASSSSSSSPRSAEEEGGEEEELAAQNPLLSQERDAVTAKMIPREVILLASRRILEEKQVGEVTGVGHELEHDTMAGSRHKFERRTSSSLSHQSVPVLDTSQLTEELQSSDGDDASLSSTSSSTHRRTVLLEDTEEVITTPTAAPTATILDAESSCGRNRVIHKQEQHHESKMFSSFAMFRMQYLIVHTAIMLADGLQGTHLYVLYEGYGYSVASLYSLGFVAGAFTSPFIGPVVDKIGRKKAAMLYCMLEMLINYMELFPIFIGLIASRMIGGITTNLLFSVFESWLVSEHRSRGFSEDKLEIILRDSTIVCNSAAILSGYLAHCLAEHMGAVGPFQGAVALTFGALVLVSSLWTENFGKGNCASELMTWKGNMVGAFRTIVNDSKISRIGIIQGMTEGSLQTFVFLWSPALRTFAASAPRGTLGMDKDGEPAYGLIFGAFMACGVLGGFGESTFRSIIGKLTYTRSDNRSTSERESAVGETKSSSVDFSCTACYLIAAMLFLIPVFIDDQNPYSFSICLGAFMCYELMVGLYMPCEGVIRSIYMPNDSICSMMTMLRVIVNVAVALGVVSTNYVPFTSAFSALSAMLMVAAVLQLSLVPRNELLKVLRKCIPVPFKSFSTYKFKSA